jgi:hypothetical protein
LSANASRTAHSVLAGPDAAQLALSKSLRTLLTDAQHSVSTGLTLPHSAVLALQAGLRQLRDLARDGILHPSMRDECLVLCTELLLLFVDDIVHAPPLPSSPPSSSTSSAAAAAAPPAAGGAAADGIETITTLTLDRYIAPRVALLVATS